MKSALSGLATLAILLTGCSGAASAPSGIANAAAPTPIIIYITPPPAPTLAATPEPTPDATPTDAPPTPEPILTPEPTPRPLSYATLTSRTWAQLVKAPDSHIGQGYKLWGCITQFDAATGLDTFRAEASYQNETDWYTNGVNTFFTGDQTQLAPFVQGDLISMSVVSLGSYSYDTQNGGSTTVPNFQVDKVKRQGSC